MTWSGMVLNEEFGRNVLLILLSAFVVSYLIPWVFRRIDAEKLRQQQIFEARLARQEKVIESQIAALDEIASALWDFQLKAIAVMYYHQPQVGHPDLYATAVSAYQENVAPLLGSIRTGISKLLRLAPQSVYDRFADLYYCDLLELDLCLSLLIQDRAKEVGPNAPRSERCDGAARGFDACTWPELQKYAVHKLPDRVDAAIAALAQSVHLSGTRAEEG